MPVRSSSQAVKKFWARVLISNTLRWINLGWIALTLLAYATPFVNPAKVWAFSCIGLGYPFLLLGNLLFIGLWLWRKQRYFLFSTACILAGAGYLPGFFGWHFFHNPKKTDAEIRVMTYNTSNLKRLDKNPKMDWNEKMQMLEEIKAQSGPLDLLCLEETSTDAVFNAFRKTYDLPYFHRFKSTIIFSRYPILQKDALPFGETSNSGIWADLQTPRGNVRAYCLHLQSNKMSYTANKIATKGNLDEQTLKDVRFVLSRFRQGVQIRAEQAEIVAKHAAKSPHPALICGDFNDTPVSYTYRIIAEKLQDSFREKGSGLGTTYAGRLPFLRIDYVLGGKRFHFLEHRIIDSELSDHLPVLARVRLNP